VRREAWSAEEAGHGHAFPDRLAPPNVRAGLDQFDAHHRCSSRVSWPSSLCFVPPGTERLFG
jgi:hypothetical protein